VIPNPFAKQRNDSIMTARDARQAISLLLDIMRTLRSPEGCPWDAQQTPASLAPYILEEAAEVVDAIESGNPEAVLDETGDLLLQVVFLAQIYDEKAQFNFADIALAISDKLIRRHPHVFTEQTNDLSQADLDLQWERIKLQEKSSDGTPPHPLGQIPTNLPGLQRMRKILDRAEKAGMLEKVEKCASGSPGETIDQEALGSQLLELVCRARRSHLDAEQVLRKKIRLILQVTEDSPINQGPKDHY